MHSKPLGLLISTLCILFMHAQDNRQTLFRAIAHKRSLNALALYMACEPSNASYQRLTQFTYHIYNLLARGNIADASTCNSEQPDATDLFFFSEYLACTQTKPKQQCLEDIVSIIALFARDINRTVHEITAHGDIDKKAI